jgi:hypothetical protein
MQCCGGIRSVVHSPAWNIKNFPFPQCSGSGILLVPWIQDGKKSKTGSEIRIRYDHPESLETIFWVKILKFLMRIRIRDPGIFLTLDLGIRDRKLRNLDPGFVNWQPVNVDITVAVRYLLLFH